MQEEFEILSLEDVVALNNNDKQQKVAIAALLSTINASYLFGVNDFLDDIILSYIKNDEVNKILKDGISCRVMTTRQKGWVSGKVKLGLHFVADEIQKEREDNQILLSSNSNLNSPLDEIRNNIG
ncbi:MAG: KGK domain-containing protein [Pseudanabaena sp.]|jgi:hypothetical protein